MFKLQPTFLAAPQDITSIRKNKVMCLLSQLIFTISFFLLLMKTIIWKFWIAVNLSVCMWHLLSIKYCDILNRCRHFLLNYLSIAATSTIKVCSIFISYLSVEKVEINENILIKVKQINTTKLRIILLSTMFYAWNHYMLIAEHIHDKLNTEILAHVVDHNFP